MIKRIMSGKKIALSSYRKQVWKTVKAETEKLNELLTTDSTKNITKLNELIYAGAKLVCAKIGVPIKKI